MSRGKNLRWKKNEPERGLRAVAAGPRGSKLSDQDGTHYASVSALRISLGRYSGWYWVAGWGSTVPHFNSCDKPVATEAEAKAEAMAYVKRALGLRGQG
jgi:hypothetical protein